MNQKKKVTDNTPKAPQRNTLHSKRPVSAINRDPMRVLIDLLKLLMNPSIDSRTLIGYIEQFCIDPNTYLPSMRGNVQIPLIYYCCSNPNLSDFFIYLLDKQVNLGA